MHSIVERLTENIVERDLQKEGAALLAKWEETGLLEGLKNDHERATMSRLLENQAKELLREASTMSSGDVEGFAAVAFPIVRRVFGGLIANDLVSVQSMSLPSSLIFFLDFKYTDTRAHAGATAGQSIYGGGVLASGITGGVDLTGANAEKSFYANNNGYTSPTGSVQGVISLVSPITMGSSSVATLRSNGSLTGSVSEKILHDPDLGESLFLSIVSVPLSTLTAQDFDVDNLIAVLATAGAANSAFASGEHLDSATQVRRLTHYNSDKTLVNLVFTATASFAGFDSTNDNVTLTFARADDWVAGGAAGSVVADLLPFEGAGRDANGIVTEAGTNVTIPEIDIKVDSVSVEAKTKKLKAKWSPELGQDLQAYHNLDAEAELTGILSEQIALEIDREIIVDLLQGATAGTLHWSRRPGKFLNRETGATTSSNSAPPDFTGTVSEWYETLVETINDVSARIHRKTLRGGANFLVCGPEVANVLEFTSGFRANVTHDEDKGTVGAVKTGNLSKKWDVWVDPYFPRHLILVGRKGSSFLESGYIYAPYVPLQVSPTVLGIEDFVPRKMVMTRYAKKLVRPDMYGIVAVHDLLG